MEQRLGSFVFDSFASWQDWQGRKAILQLLNSTVPMPLVAASCPSFPSPLLISSWFNPLTLCLHCKGMTHVSCQLLPVSDTQLNISQHIAAAAVSQQSKMQGFANSLCKICRAYMANLLCVYGLPLLLSVGICLVCPCWLCSKR